MMFFLFVILFTYYHDNLLAEFGHSPEHACVHYRPNRHPFVNPKSNETVRQIIYLNEINYPRIHSGVWWLNCKTA